MKDTLEYLNTAKVNEARLLLLEFCNSSNWADSMMQNRPYTSLEQIIKQSELSWLNCKEDDILEAFEGHPRIGDLNALENKYAHHANTEQGQVAHTQDHILQQLQKRNSEYEEKFGFIFIVCANGKSALEMLQILESRLLNDRRSELQNGADNQLKITQLRINRWWNQNT